MEWIAYLFGTLGFIFGMSALNKISALEKKLEKAGVLPAAEDQDSDLA